MRKIVSYISNYNWAEIFKSIRKIKYMKKNLCYRRGRFYRVTFSKKVLFRNNDVIIIDDLSRKLTKYNLKFIDKKVKFIQLDISKKNFNILKRFLKKLI